MGWVSHAYKLVESSSACAGRQAPRGSTQVVGGHLIKLSAPPSHFQFAPPARSGAALQAAGVPKNNAVTVGQTRGMALSREVFLACSAAASGSAAALTR